MNIREFNFLIKIINQNSTTTIISNYNAKEFQTDDVFDMYRQSCDVTEFSVAALFASSKSLSTNGIQLAHIQYKLVLLYIFTLINLHNISFGSHEMQRLHQDKLVVVFFKFLVIFFW